MHELPELLTVFAMVYAGGHYGHTSDAPTLTLTLTQPLALCLGFFFACEPRISALRTITSTHLSEIVFMKKIVLLVAALMFLFPVPAGGLPASDPGHTPCSVQRNCPASLGGMNPERR
jgi:hypothetical protein